MESHYEVNVALNVTEGAEYTYQRHYFKTTTTSEDKALELKADFMRVWPNAVVTVTYWECVGKSVGGVN